MIIYICKQPQCVEDKESRNLNKIFLQTLNNDLSMTIDENNEKKMNISWNLENYYKMMKSQLESLLRLMHVESAICVALRIKVAEEVVVLSLWTWATAIEAAAQ